MEVKINNSKLILIEGDITKQNTEAIVNAANNSLLGGGGVDGAIHRAGGPAILAECKKLNGCATGEAKITTGGNLKARFVIHTVGPIWRGGKNKEDKLLASCYKKSLQIAEENNLTSISFPSISTGAYGFPLEPAAKIALQEVINYLKQNTKIKEVYFVLFGSENFNAYKKVLEEIV